MWGVILFSGADEATEVPWEEGARLINDCTYLYAKEIREIQELTLGLIIVEAKAQAPVSATEEAGPLAFLKIGGRPIEEDEMCRLFQLLSLQCLWLPRHWPIMLLSQRYFLLACDSPGLWIAASRRTMSASRSAIVAFDRS